MLSVARKTVAHLDVRFPYIYCTLSTHALAAFWIGTLDSKTWGRSLTCIYSPRSE